MSENISKIESVNAEAVEAEGEPLSQEVIDLANAVPEQVVQMLLASVTEANETGRKIRDAAAGRDAQRTNLLNETDAPEVVKWREWEAKAAAKAAELEAQRKENRDAIMAIVDGLLQDDFDLDAAKATFGDARKRVTSAENFIANMFDSDTLDAVKAVNNVSEVIGLSGIRKTAGVTGIKRYRLDSLFIDGAGLDKPTFSNAATAINAKVPGAKVAASALSDAAEKAAGTNDLTTKAGEEISFVYTVSVDGTDTAVKVDVTPQAKSD